jgi:hypothetical protein
MKKYFVAALALAGMFACSRVENVGPQPNAAIRFADSFVEIKTRAAADPSTTTESISEFVVWGFMDDTQAAVFNGATVTKQTDGTWTYGDLQYWLPSHTYYFGAVSPVGHKDVTIDVAGANEYGLGEISFVNTDGSVDLLYAAKSVTTSNDVISVDPGKVQLQFSHLLSKVKFTFTNGFTTENTTLKVENITMTAPSEGKINLAQEDWWTNNAWVITKEDGLVLDFGSVKGGAALAATETSECDTERLTIPHSATHVYTITFDVKLYVGDYATPAYAVTREVKLTDQPLKIGKNYNFKTTIDYSNIHPDGPLKPIEFEVIEVKEWVEDTANKLI